MRKQAARVVLQNILCMAPISLPCIFLYPHAASRLSPVLIPTKGLLPHTEGPTGRGKWKTHRPNTIRPHRPKHVAGWILPMKRSGSPRRVKYRNDSPYPASLSLFSLSISFPLLSLSLSLSAEPSAARRGWMIVWRFTDECRSSYNCNEP